MWEDPIVADIHRTREKLAAQFNFDVKAIFADLRSRQRALGARLVSPKKQPSTPIAVDSAPLPIQEGRNINGRK
jgi:hypothetical protein